jgi:hypothetical protein
MYTSNLSVEHRRGRKGIKQRSKRKKRKNSDRRGSRKKHRHTKIMKTALNLLRLKALESDVSLACSESLPLYPIQKQMNHVNIQINYYLKKKEHYLPV